MGAVRRVLLPMLMPAIFASAVLVFADVIDDFVIVRYLSGDSSTEPTSVKIYNTARAAPTPALNALATLMLLASFLAVVIGLLVYRWLSRGEKGASGIESFAEACESICGLRHTARTACLVHEGPQTGSGTSGEWPVSLDGARVAHLS